MDEDAVCGGMQVSMDTVWLDLIWFSRLLDSERTYGVGGRHCEEICECVSTSFSLKLCLRLYDTWNKKENCRRVEDQLCHRLG